jgi:lipopolysaccharide transport system ATP-binding protein
MHLAKNDNPLVQDSDALTFDVQDAAEKRDGWYGKWEGAIRPIFDWDTEIVTSK